MVAAAIVLLAHPSDEEYVVVNGESEDHRESAGQRKGVDEVRTAEQGLLAKSKASAPKDALTPRRLSAIAISGRLADELDQLPGALLGGLGVVGFEFVARLRGHGAVLIGEIAQYEDVYRLCFLRGPDGIIIGLAERLS